MSTMRPPSGCFAPAICNWRTRWWRRSSRLPASRACETAEDRRSARCPPRGCDIGLANSVTRAAFGSLPDGRTVEAVTLHGSAGMQAVVINYGATLQSVIVPDRNGMLADVVLGPGSLQPYLENPQYFGATVGRFANRIAHGAFHLD